MAEYSTDTTIYQPRLCRIRAKDGIMRINLRTPTSTAQIVSRTHKGAAPVNEWGVNGAWRGHVNYVRGNGGVADAV